MFREDGAMLPPFGAKSILDIAGKGNGGRLSGGLQDDHIVYDGIFPVSDPQGGFLQFNVGRAKYILKRCDFISIVHTVLMSPYQTK